MKLFIKSEQTPEIPQTPTIKISHSLHTNFSSLLPRHKAKFPKGDRPLHKQTINYLAQVQLESPLASVARWTASLFWEARLRARNRWPFGAPRRLTAPTLEQPRWHGPPCTRGSTRSPKPRWPGWPPSTTGISSWGNPSFTLDLALCESTMQSATWYPLRCSSTVRFNDRFLTPAREAALPQQHPSFYLLLSVDFWLGVVIWDVVMERGRRGGWTKVDSIGVVDRCGARFMDRSLVRIEWVEQSGRSRLIDAWYALAAIRSSLSLHCVSICFVWLVDWCLAMFIGQRYELICTGVEAGFLGYHRIVSPEE